MNNNTIETITKAIETEINSNSSETKINVYLMHRTDPKEYWDRLRFVISIFGIVAVICLVCFVAFTSYFSSRIF